MVELLIGGKTPQSYISIGDSLINQAMNWGLTQSIKYNNPTVKTLYISVLDDIPAAGSTGDIIALGMKHDQVGSSVTIDVRAFIPASYAKSPIQVLYHEIGHVAWPGAAPPDKANPNGNHLVRTNEYGSSFAEYLVLAAAGDGFVLAANDLANAKRSYNSVVVPQCFLAGTEITMWDGTKKPIEDITPNDRVLSHDKNGNPVPGRVARTFTNEAKIILDFHGTQAAHGPRGQAAGC